MGKGIISLVSATVVQRHFQQNRGLANGLSMLGFSVGNIIGPMIITDLIHFFGWRGALILIGGMTINTAVIGLTFHPPANQAPLDNTTSAGCTRGCKKSLDLSLFKNKPLAIFVVSAFLQDFYVTGFLNFTPLRAVFSGISIDGAAFLSTVTFIGSTSMHTISVFVSNMKSVDHIILFSLGVVLGVPGVLFTLLFQQYFGGIIGCLLVGFSFGE